MIRYRKKRYLEVCLNISNICGLLTLVFGGVVWGSEYIGVSWDVCRKVMQLRRDKPRKEDDAEDAEAEHDESDASSSESD